MMGLACTTVDPERGAEPVRVERRASNSGVVMVVGQKLALGGVHAHKAVTIDVADVELTV